MKTILCIDDDGWVLATLMDALKTRGYRVLVTTSTNAGPSCLKYDHVDLVLLDLNMPTRNGLAVYHELEAVGPVPVLFVTGCTRMFAEQRREYEEELKAVKTDLLAKPFTLAQLYEKVEAMIGSGDPDELTSTPPPKPSTWFKRLMRFRFHPQRT